MRPLLRSRVALALLAYLSIPAGVLAVTPLDIRTFTSGQSVWFSDGNRLFAWRTEGRSLAGVSLSDSLDTDSIFSITESEGSLWILAASGVMKVDMSTGTVERISGSLPDGSHARIAADMDYMWLLTPQSLRRYDKLGREWFDYPLPISDGTVLGAYSDGDIVYCISGSNIRRFSVLDEKWTSQPLPGFALTPSARMYVHGKSLVVVDGSKIFRYLIDSQSWDKIDARAEVVDIYFAPSLFYYMTGSASYQYNTEASVAQILDIPDATGAKCLAALGDTALLPTNRAIVKYSLAGKSSDNLEYSQRTRGAEITKIFPAGNLLALVSPDQFAIYDPGTQLWEEFSLAASQARRSRLAWNDQNGLRARYSPTTSSQLRGTVTQDFKLDFANKDSAFQVDSTLIQHRVADTTIGDTQYLDTLITDDTLYDSLLGKPFYWGNALPIVDLTLHNSFANDRYLDLHFDNTNVSRPPNKSLYYRGNQRDNLAWLRGGTNTFELPQSLTLPKARFEGGAVAVDSRSALKERDRKIVRTEAGAGFITAQTQVEVLSYAEDGIYRASFFKVDTTKNVSIVPGSIRVTIDGEEIDSSSFIFSSVTGDIRFLRDDIIDPTSVIRVLYQLQTVPEFIPRDVEFVPSEHFGDLEYAMAAVSPTEWMTAEAGYLTVGRDSTRHHIAHVAVPLEFRKTSPDLLLKVNPEFSYEASEQSYAAGLGVQGRIFKRTSLLFNGLIADSAYQAADKLSHGYGYVKHQTDFTVSHNFLPEIPVSYSQYDRYFGNGEEHRYEARAGAHFVKIPFFDVTVSRNMVDTTGYTPVYQFDTTVVPIDTTPDPLDFTSIIDTTILDSLVPFHRLKDKLQLRLYESSSPFLEKILHLIKLNYDFSYTVFGTQEEEDSTRGTGHIWFGRLTLCPLSSIALTGQSLIRKNPRGSRYDMQYDPSLLLQITDAPPGIDFTAGYSLGFGSWSGDSTDTSTISIERSLGLAMRPGAWVSWLSWFSTRIGVTQTVGCEFDSLTPDGGEIVFGNSHVVNRLLSPYVGVRLYPTNEITFQNNNKWSLGDSIENFGSFNDLKWYFGANRLWQTRWEYDRAPKGGEAGQTVARHYHRAWTRFESAWTGWLKTSVGVSTNYRNLDSIYLDSNDVQWVSANGITKTGPEVGITLSFQKISIIKKLMNSHTLGLFWTNSHGATEMSPEVGYSIFLKALFTPNISLNTTNTLTWSQGALDQYFGKVSLAILF